MLVKFLCSMPRNSNSTQVSCVELLVQIAGSDDVGPVVPRERREFPAIQTHKAVGQNEDLAHAVILPKGLFIHVSIFDQVNFKNVYASCLASSNGTK